jgi:UDP-GlcNAc:undecaprenyl-phosphate GlcNAc-1-phosphate transferase
MGWRCDAGIATSFTFAVVSHLPLVGKSFGREAQGIFLAGTFVVLLGMIDDRFELDALTKLAGQALAAGIMLSFGVQLLWLPINGLITLPPSIGQLLTVLIILVAINAVNFIDGMDGLASGVVAVAATAFFIFAYVLAVVYGFNRAGAPSTFSAVLIGVCLGFLPHNAFPAKIFMGDSGSMYLGLMLGAAAITLTGQFDPNAIQSESTGPTFLPLLLPFAVLAIPLADFGMAVVRRIRAGRSPFAPDNEHLHHKLFNRGNSQLRTVIIMYLWTAAIAFPVTTWAFKPWWAALAVAIIFGGSSILVMKRKGQNVG